MHSVNRGNHQIRKEKPMLEIFKPKKPPTQTEKPIQNQRKQNKFAKEKLPIEVWLVLFIIISLFGLILAAKFGWI